MKRMPDLVEYVDHFRARVLQDALIEATADYWERRAAQFAAVGNARCDVIAEACRNRATVALLEKSPDALDGCTCEREAPTQLICSTCGTPTSPWTCSCGETCIDPRAVAA